MIPRKVISFALVGTIGVFIQFFAVHILIWLFDMRSEKAIPFCIRIATYSNYLINNSLTFYANRLKNKALIIGMCKFLFVSSLPIIANIGLVTSF